MAANEIKIIIGGDAGGILRASQETSTALASVSSTVKSAGQAVSQLNAPISNAAKTISQLGPAATDAAQGVERLRNGLRDAAGQSELGSIGTQATSALRPIAQLEAEIASLQKQLSQTTNVRLMESLNIQLAKTQSQLNNMKVVGFGGVFDKVGSGARGAAAGIAKIADPSKAATSALTDVNRVIQDSAFGFVGIQNNITELPKSFRALSLAAKESGQSVGKVFLSTLIGPAGIGTALSIVTAALTFATVGFGAWTRGFSQSGKAAKDAADENQKFADTVDGIIKSTAEEVSRVGVLVNFIGRETTTRKERTAAIKELQSISPQYFAQLNAEKSTVEDISASYAAFSRNIQNSIKSRVFAEQLKKITEERLKLEESINQKGEDEIIVSNKLTKVRNFDLRTQSEKNLEQAKYSLLLKQEEELTKRINDLQSPELKTGSTEKEVDALKQRIAALKELQGLTGLTANQQVQLAQLEIQLASRDAVKLGFTEAELQQQIEGILEKAFPVATFEFDLEAKPKIDAKALTDGFATDIAEATKNQIIEIPAPSLRFTNLKDAVDQARQQIGETLFASLVRGIEEGSAAIGEAFAGLFSGDGVTNALAKAAQGLLSIVGGILQDVGKQIIVTSTLVKALKAAISKLFGPGGEAIGLAVGAALIATGALLKNIKFNVPKLAEGGIASRATLGIFGEAGREAIIPLDKLPQMMGKLNFANETPVVLQPSIRFSLSDFQIGLERVDNRRRRLG